jgi:hypothetical protein
MPTNIKPPKGDKGMTGLAGEFFVAAELLRRHVQVAVTFGNAKAIDLFASNPNTGRTFKVQVKSLRSRSKYFLLGSHRPTSDQIYVFALLNEPGQAVEYLIVPGGDLVAKLAIFGRGLHDEKMPGVLPRDLEGYKDKWGPFDELAAAPT